MGVATAPSIAEGEIRAVFETSRCRSLPTTNSSRRSLRKRKGPWLRARSAVVYLVELRAGALVVSVDPFLTSPNFSLGTRLTG
jgi:hypothetical protein